MVFTIKITDPPANPAWKDKDRTLTAIFSPLQLQKHAK